MKTDMRGKLHLAETALLLALCLTLLLAAWGQAAGAGLSSHLVRLHVIADSDEPAEQELKLRVRDAVLACTGPLLETADGAAEARTILADHLDEVARAAESAAEGRTVRVELSRENYPTRYYDGFALPAGEYTSLRVLLGEAQGQNWWCVIFPPLCTAASSETAADVLAGGDAGLITRQGGYVLKFRAAELWGELRAALDG